MNHLPNPPETCCVHYESIFHSKRKNNVPLSMQVCTQQITETKKQVSLNKKTKQNKKKIQ